MHSCIYTVRRKAKYSSSSPSCCSILLQGRSPSRDAGWPKDAKIYLLTVHDQSMSTPCLPLLFPLVCLYMLQYSYLQGDNPALSLYNVQAYAGLCVSVCIQCELRPIPFDSLLMLNRAILLPGLPPGSQPLQVFLVSSLSVLLNAIPKGH